MKLDKRIKDRNHIFDCFNAEDAKEYIGEECYMTDNLELFDNLDILYKYRLDSIYDNSYFYNAEDDDHFKFCLPVRLVEPKKKKTYRSFTIEEFCNKRFAILVFREKANPLMEYHVRYNGYRKCDIFYKVILGNISYTLSDLFDGFELLDRDGNWKPFGVEE